MKNHIRPAMIARPTAPPAAPPAIAPVSDEEDDEELLLENPAVPLVVAMTVAVPPPPANDPVDAVFVVTAPGTPAVFADDMLVVAPGGGLPEDEVADVV